MKPPSTLYAVSLLFYCIPILGQLHGFGGEQSVHQLNAQKAVPHFSGLETEALPVVDLAQYASTGKVMRLDYLALSALEALAFKKEWYTLGIEVGFDHWAHSAEKRFFDVRVNDPTDYEVMWDGFASLGVVISAMVEDVAQTVFETFPQGAADAAEAAADTIKLQAYLAQDVTLAEAGSQAAKDELDAMTEVFFKQYRDLATLHQWFERLRAVYPTLLKHERIGKTYEGRNMAAMHLSLHHASDPHGNVTSQHEDDLSSRNTIVITGGVHAREWISTSTVCYSLYRLLRSYDAIQSGTDERHHRRTRRILEKLDFIFLPVFNPDGYYHTWTVDRLWRKNRQETFNPRCYGLDVDHSFGYRWQQADEFNPCGENYSGEDAFEALEAHQWNQFLSNHTNQIVGYLDLHSYSQQILYPYAWSCEQLPRDSENLIELAYGMSKAIRLSSGRSYAVLPACVDRDVDIEPSLGAGTSLDFMYHNKAYWAFQIKLRDSGAHGFLLPAKNIVPVGKEIYAALKHFCVFILDSTEY